MPAGVVGVDIEDVRQVAHDLLNNVNRQTAR
jgi:hypothetical protein